MKKYLVAALVACLGILSVNAQVDKTIEVSQCEANNKLTVEGQTLISTSYGNLVFPENVEQESDKSGSGAQISIEGIQEGQIQFQCKRRTL